MAEKHISPYAVFEMNAKRLIEFSSIDPRTKCLLLALMGEILLLIKSQHGDTQPSIWLR